MSVGAILTLGLGQFGTVNLLPTLGYLSSSIPPPAPVTTQNTPGRVRIPSQIRGETHEEATARRIREGSLPATTPLVSDDGRLAEYSRKSAQVTAAIARLRDETGGLQNETGALRIRIGDARKARERMRLEKALMLKEQALTFARAQEAALLEELMVIDIAYVSIIAIGVLLQ